MAGWRPRRKLPKQGDLPQQWSIALPDYVNDLRFSPDGTLLAAATLAGPVVVLNAAQGDVRYQLDGHAGGAFAVAWSPDGKRLATSGQDGMVRLVEGTTGSVVVQMEGGDAWVEHLVWSPNGKHLAAAAGKLVQFFSSGGKIIGVVKSHVSTVSSMVWLPHVDLAVTACYGGIQFLAVDSAQPVKQYAWKGSILSLAVTPDGKYLASGNQDNSVHAWRAENGEDFQMAGYPTKVTTLAFSANSSTLATGGGKDLALWDFSGKGPAGKAPTVLKGHDGLVSALVFARMSGQPRLISVGRDGKLCTWAPHVLPRTVSVTQGDTPLERVAADPQGRLIAVADKTGRVSMFIHQ
jgi:WD40 repeat protein